jgi:putative zinc finger protein
MPGCQTPISDGTLLDYWARDLTDGGETDRVEEHLFGCSDCSARLHALAALGTGLATLVRQGRVSGIVSRALLNRMQRDGLHVRMYSLAPGETVPCCVFPDDDLIVTALRADLSAVEAVTLSVTASGDSPFSQLDNVPVSRPDGEVFWATPAAVVRQLPSMRLQLTLASAGETRAELGRYVLEHSASPPA